MMKNLFSITILPFLLYAIYIVTVPFTITVGGSGDFTFSLPTGSVLHYIDASVGSDSADGLAPTVGGGHGPWASPNHAMNCGEVILVNAGTYNGLSPVGTVSNCPSSSGGIDGTGQIYFAIILCAATDLEGCVLRLTGSCGGCDNVNLGNSNWAMEGFKCDGVTNINYCYQFDTGALNRITHHDAYINNIAYNSAQGFATNGCPSGTCTHNIPGEGSDYLGIVGNIAMNSAQANCVGAIDIVAPGVFDQAAGTHNIIYGNFSYKNLGTCTSDGSGLYFDTWDAHGVAYQGVIANNITWNNERFGTSFTHSGDHLTAVATILYHNNTIYSNCQGSYTEFFCGGQMFNNTDFTHNLPPVGAVQNNISLETFATQGGGGGNGPVYAMAFSGKMPGMTIGGTGNENIYMSASGRTPCSAASCAPGPVASGASCTPNPCGAAENDGNTLGTNIYTDPLFTNTADLITNRSGVPNCTGFENVTQCMGYNARTGTLTTPSVISDMVPTCTSCTGKGYQKPSTTCTSNAEYPTYLKGIVYLHASGFTLGATITEKAGLVTKPCNM